MRLLGGWLTADFQFKSCICAYIYLFIYFAFAQKYTRKNDKVTHELSE